MVAFDTAVADLTPLLHDPVDVLFGIQLGGGTDINRAAGLLPLLVTRPADTVLVLVSATCSRAASPGELGRGWPSSCGPASPCVVLLALSDDGVPAHDHGRAAGWPRSAPRPSPARRTSSPTSWPPRSSAATSAVGPASKVS